MLQNGRTAQNNKTTVKIKWIVVNKGGGALCAGNAVALLVFGPVMP